MSFNAVGGSTFRKDLRLLGAGGALVMFGGAERGGGTLGALGFVWRMGLVVPITLMMNSRSLIGVNMLRLGDRRPELLGQLLTECVGAAEQGILRPAVQEVLPYERLPEALMLLARGSTIGKVALKW